MIDYHLHGNFCGHGSGELEEYVEEALRKGFVEIGFSAHLPRVDRPDPYHAMVEEDLPRYVELVLSLRERFRGSIAIKLGIEADFFDGYEEAIGRLLDAHPFDYVFGSIHFLDGWHFSSRAGRERYDREDPDRVFPRYFALLECMVRSGLFDIAAHPDIIRKESFMPSFPLDGYYKRFAGLLVRYGMAVEVNTAGVRRGAGTPYPERLFLETCHDAGVPVTLGSDAHRPGDVGRDFKDAFALLAELGIDEVAVFESRRFSMRPIRFPA